MPYKIINNVLDSGYGVNLIDSLFSFKRINISDLTEEIQNGNKEEMKTNAENNIISDFIFNPGTSIDDILASSPDTLTDADKKDIVKEIKPVIEKINLQRSISIKEDIDPDEKLKKLANKIELIESPKTESNYHEKILDTLGTGAKNTNKYIDTLINYKNAINLTWYDIGSIARSINSLFSAFFQQTFTELSKYFPKLSSLDLECDEQNALKKIMKDQPLELYEMFKIVYWIQEKKGTNLISQIKEQENKDKYNILKSYLESESHNGNIKGHFYVLTLDYLRCFRNFHAHHDDERLVKRYVKGSSPEKMKNKLYDKFLGNFEEDGKGLLQFVLERI